MLSRIQQKKNYAHFSDIQLKSSIFMSRSSEFDVHRKILAAFLNLMTLSLTRLISLLAFGIDHVFIYACI